MYNIYHISIIYLNNKLPGYWNSISSCCKLYVQRKAEKCIHQYIWYCINHTQQHHHQPHFLDRVWSSGIYVAVHMTGFLHFSRLSAIVCVIVKDHSVLSLTSISLYRARDFTRQNSAFTCVHWPFLPYLVWCYITK